MTANDATTVDTYYCFWDDSGGRDPDKYSPTLKAYHRELWSKPLPDGTELTLDDTVAGCYLSACLGGETMKFSSDSIVPTYFWHGVEWIDESQWVKDVFRREAYTIGGMLIFPSERYDGKMTLNGARGFHKRIGDRMDLTLECIRRHYCGQSSPLTDAMSRYRSFFKLFGDFRGYVDFFLLQDLVTNNYETVRFFLPFDDFASPGRPADTESYLAYARSSLEFVWDRNDRIEDWFVGKPS